MRTHLWLMLILVGGLQSCGYRGLVNPNVTQVPAGGQTKVMVVPADFVINEVGFGRSQERVVAWELTASKAFENAVKELSDNQTSYAVANYDQLSSDEHDVLDQHRALFATMVPILLQIKEGKTKVWTEKRSNLTYSLGDGLAFLKRKYEVDYVIFVIGKDTVRSTGRIVLDLFKAVIPGAESLSASNAYVVVGIANAANGEILFFDTDTAKRKSLSNEGDVKEMARNSLSDFRNLTRQKVNSK